MAQASYIPHLRPIAGFVKEAEAPIIKLEQRWLAALDLIPRTARCNHGHRVFVPADAVGRGRCEDIAPRAAAGARVGAPAAVCGTESRQSALRVALNHESQDLPRDSRFMRLNYAADLASTRKQMDRCREAME